MAVRRTTLLPSAFVLVVPFSSAIVSAQAVEGAHIIQSDALGTGARFHAGRSDCGALWRPLKEWSVCATFEVPCGYEVATHSHSTDGLLTIISGKARLAFGEKADNAHARDVSGQCCLMAGPSQHDVLRFLTVAFGVKRNLVSRRPMSSRQVPRLTSLRKEAALLG